MKDYGTDGQPLLLAKGYSIVRRVYDENRRVIREEYYGVHD